MVSLLFPFYVPLADFHAVCEYFPYSCRGEKKHYNCILKNIFKTSIVHIVQDVDASMRSECKPRSDHALLIIKFGPDLVKQTKQRGRIACIDIATRNIVLYGNEFYLFPSKGDGTPLTFDKEQVHAKLSECPCFQTPSPTQV